MSSFYVIVSWKAEVVGDRFMMPVVGMVNSADVVHTHDGAMNEAPTTFVLVWCIALLMRYV